MAERSRGGRLVGGGGVEPTSSGLVWLSLVALLAALAVSCGDDDETTGPTTTAVATGGSAGTGGGPGGSGNGGAGLSGGSGATGGTGGTGATGGGSAAGSLIIVDPDDPAWLAYQDGSSYFLCGPGDPEGFLYRGTRNGDGTRDGDQLDLINKLIPTGANGIYLMAVRSHGGDGGSTENPFVDSNPTSGLDQDILDQWESWFSAMDLAGITIYFFFYDDSASIWSTGDAVGAAEQGFIEGLVNAFEHHDHLIWVVAEEYSERFSTQRVSNIAATIRAADDRNHVIAVHQLNGLSFNFAADPNVDQFAIQYNQSTAPQLHSGMVTAFTSAAGAYNLNMSEAADYGTGAIARRKSWASAMGGAYVMVLGQDIASTAVSDLQTCGRLREFMETTNLSGMTPRDDLARGGTQYVLAAEGQRYLAYASALSGEMGLAGVPAGNWDLSWFDPTNGTWEHESVSVPGGDVTWPKPASMGTEVVVYVR